MLLELMENVHLSIYLYILAISPSFGGSRQLKETTKTIFTVAENHARLKQNRNSFAGNLRNAY